MSFTCFGCVCGGDGAGGRGGERGKAHRKGWAWLPGLSKVCLGGNSLCVGLGVKG